MPTRLNPDFGNVIEVLEVFELSALSEKDCPNRLTLEAELNDRVAHLYGLTAEEKKIVEGILPDAKDDGGGGGNQDEEGEE